METRDIAKIYLEWDRYDYFFDSGFSGLSLQYDGSGKPNLELKISAREKINECHTNVSEINWIEKAVCVKLKNIIEMKYRHTFNRLFLGQISLRYQEGGYIVTFECADELDIDEADWREQSQIWFIAENIEVVALEARKSSGHP